MPIAQMQKEFITVLAAVYAICYLTGGSAVGLSFSIGDQNVSVLDKFPPLGCSAGRTRPHLERLETTNPEERVGALIRRLRL